jgi:hypothetical protein
MQKVEGSSPFSRFVQRLPLAPAEGAALVARDGDMLVLAAVSWRQGARGDRTHHPRLSVPVFPRAWVNTHRRLAGCRALRFDAIDVIVDAQLKLISLAHVQEVAQPPVRISRSS